MLFNDIIQGQFYEMTGKCHYINKRTQTCPYSLLVRPKRVLTPYWSVVFSINKTDPHDITEIF